MPHNIFFMSQHHFWLILGQINKPVTMT